MSDLVPTRKTKTSSEKPASTAASCMTILLEDIQGKVQVTMEAVTGLRTELRSEIQALRTELCVGRTFPKAVEWFSARTRMVLRGGRAPYRPRARP
jgi:hypothetical protein